MAISVNKAKLIYALQKFYLDEQKRGVKVRHIYETVNMLYPMSRTTFYNYMGMPVATELENISKYELKKFSNHVIKSLQQIREPLAIN